MYTTSEIKMWLAEKGCYHNAYFTIRDMIASDNMWGVAEQIINDFSLDNYSSCDDIIDAICKSSDGIVSS